MKKKKLIRELALANSEIINLRNKLRAEIAIKVDRQDVYRSTLEEMLLVCTYAGAGLEEFDIATGKLWRDVPEYQPGLFELQPRDTPGGFVNVTVKQK